MGNNKLAEPTIESIFNRRDELTDEEFENMIIKLHEERARSNIYKDIISKDTSADKQTAPSMSFEQRVISEDEDDNPFYLEHSNDKAVDEERRLVVEGLMQNTAKEHLKLFFKDFDVENIFIPRKVNRNNKYFAFVDVDSKEAARRAVEHLSAHALPGLPRRQVQVTIARPSRHVPISLVDVGQNSSCLTDSADKGNVEESKDFLVKHDSKLTETIKGNQADSDGLDLSRFVLKDNASSLSANSSIEFEEMLSKTNLVTQEYNDHKLAEQNGEEPPPNRSIRSSSSGRGSDVVTRTSDVTIVPHNNPEKMDYKEQQSDTLVVFRDPHSIEPDELIDPLARQKAVVPTKEGVKTHCLFYFRNGYCDYMQQGCKYSHQLPPGGLTELTRHELNLISDRPTPRIRPQSQTNISGMNASPPLIIHRASTPQYPLNTHGSQQTSFYSTNGNQSNFSDQVIHSSHPRNLPRDSRSERKMSEVSHRNEAARTNVASGLEASLYTTKIRMYPAKQSSYKVCDQFPQPVASRTRTLVHKPRQSSHIVGSVASSNSKSQNGQARRVEIHDVVRGESTQAIDDKKHVFNHGLEDLVGYDLISFDQPSLI